MPNCQSCNEWAGDERWRKLCRKCFGLQKRREEEDREAQLSELAALCMSLQTQLRNAGGIPQDRLKKLIVLCHPDKHNNSQTSTEITQWLLTLRKK